MKFLSEKNMMVFLTGSRTPVLQYNNPLVRQVQDQQNKKNLHLVYKEDCPDLPPVSVACSSTKKNIFITIFKSIFISRHIINRIKFNNSGKNNTSNR